MTSGPRLGRSTSDMSVTLRRELGLAPNTSDKSAQLAGPTALARDVQDCLPRCGGRAARA